MLPMETLRLHIRSIRSQAARTERYGDIQQSQILLQCAAELEASLEIAAKMPENSEKSSSIGKVVLFKRRAG